MFLKCHTGFYKSPTIFNFQSIDGTFPGDEVATALGAYAVPAEDRPPQKSFSGVLSRDERLRIKDDGCV